MDGEGRVLSLPPRAPQHTAALEQLITACQPATFGRGGKDVYDETYRRAGALSAAEFMTDFCPYETGIIDVVTQLLLPPITDAFDGNSPMNREAVKDVDDAMGSPEVSRVLSRHMMQYNGPGDLHSSQLGSFLDELGVPFQNQDEMDIILQGLDPAATGYLFSTDVKNLAIERREAIALMGGRKLPIPALLRPAGGSGDKRKTLARGLRAELYKLNVYSGPSGTFKPHVDTPRHASQIGSLVICLPVEFTGGALAVRHQGQELVHEWSRSSRAPEHYNEAAILWAAFYSDCEHEVLPVTKGHRLTLTYNLFLSPGTGLLAGNPLSLNPTCLPIAKHLKTALASPAFAPAGMYLAFSLAHSYPHSNETLTGLMPKMLKGVDMALYESVYIAGLPCLLEGVTDKCFLHEHVLEKLDDIAYGFEVKRDFRGCASTSHEVNSLLEAMKTSSGSSSEADDNWNEEDINMHSSDEEDSIGRDARAARYSGYAKLKRRLKARERVQWVGSPRGNEEVDKVWMAVSRGRLLRGRRSVFADSGNSTVIKLSSRSSTQASHSLCEFLLGWKGVEGEDGCVPQLRLEQCTSVCQQSQCIPPPCLKLTTTNPKQP